MPLFDDFVRVEMRPRRQNEGAFQYLNISTRPFVCAVRELLEEWFGHLPEDSRADIRGRLRANDEIQHQSAFFELFWHELLLRSGYEVEIHPVLGDVQTRPDFLARRGGERQFFLEATLAMPPEEPGADRRFAEFYDTLNRMNSPDFFLEIQYRGRPNGNIRGRVLRRQLEDWFEQLDYDEISALYATRRFDEVPSLTIPEQGMFLTFKPIPKGPNSRGQPGARPVGLVMPMEIRQVRTDLDIRAAIDGKAKAYGQLDLPLIVAVNVMDDLFGDDDLLSALFGDEQLIAIQQGDGQWREEWGARVANGTWRGRAGPRNQLVSTVAISHQMLPSTLRARDVEIIHNPWAAHALPLEAFRLSQRTIALPDGRITRHQGVIAADILAVPDPWPVRPEE